MQKDGRSKHLQIALFVGAQQLENGVANLNAIVAKLARCIKKKMEENLKGVWLKQIPRPLVGSLFL